jgi:hypothetical protein
MDSDADMTHMTGLDGGHWWGDPRRAIRDERIRDERYVTSGIALDSDQGAAPVREPVRLGSGNYRCQSDLLKEARALLQIAQCEET